MNHTPSRYSLLFMQAVDVEAFAGPVSHGDQATVYDADGNARTYQYDAFSVAAPNALTVLNGPGGTGRWILGDGTGNGLTFAIKFHYDILSASLLFASASDPSIAGDLITIVKEAAGHYTLTFGVGSVIRPTAAAPRICGVVVTPNMQDFGSGVGFYGGANAVEVFTATFIPDAPSAVNTDFTLLLTMLP